MPLDASAAQTPEPLRPHWAMESRERGDCRTLTGDIIITILFVDEPGNPWTDEARQEAKESHNEAVYTIYEQAESYGASLDVRYIYLDTSISSPKEWSGDPAQTEEALKNASLPTLNEYAQWVRTTYDVKEAPILLCFNRSGRHFAMPTENETGGEYAVIYGTDDNFDHELYHLFGAIDLYGESVSPIAGKYWPESVMLAAGECWVDPLNAFLMGWTEGITPEIAKFLEETKDFTPEQQYVQVDVIDGYGEQETAQGRYEGYFQNGLYHGQGRYEATDGWSYDGQWEAGYYHGQGLLTYADGSTYDGQWEKGLQHGWGRMDYADGSWYEGSWDSGSIHGQGTFVDAQGQRWEGQWNQGDYVG